MKGIYSFFITLLTLGIRLASPFDPKARKWVTGRRGWKNALEKKCAEGKWVWFHCASLGEFEQGRPLMEEMKKRMPNHKLLVTFFSPSGYEVRKNYDLADYVCYLPTDSVSNASAFLSIVKPELVIFIKYELWVNMFLEMGRRKIPHYLVSAKVVPSSRFFKSIFSGLFREVFFGITHIFTQDEESEKLISAFSGNVHITVSGDTRFDRVLQVANSHEEVPVVKNFVGKHPCIIAGSIWPKDERVIMRAFAQLKGSPLRWIIAPHEIKQSYINRLIEERRDIMVAYSTISKLQPWHRLLWIDNIGMLSKLYQYGTVAYIGGGFDRGIHNILEAVAYGCPVIFGPNHKRFPEAVALVENGGAIAISSSDNLASILRQFTDDEEYAKAFREKNREWVRQQAGATALVVSKLAEFGHFPA